MAKTQKQSILWLLHGIIKITIKIMPGLDQKHPFTLIAQSFYRPSLPYIKKEVFDMNRIKNAIGIYGARQNNLKNVSLKLPKNKITVFTGVSGSGKSSLCLDTIAAESRRELNETFPSFVQQYLPKYGRPDVERIENLPVTIVLDQKKPTANSRSTVGTYTDIYAFLRLLFSRVGKPFVGYSDSFSFNHPYGKCDRCQGLGVVQELDIHKLVDFDKALNDPGVIQYPAFTTGAWRWKRYAFSGLFDLDKKINDYSEKELELFLYSPQVKLKNPPSNWPKSAKYEGIIPRMYRSIIHSQEGKKYQKVLDKMVTAMTCPQCHGQRLNEKILSCRIQGKNIADVCDMPIPQAISFIEGIENHLAPDLKRELLKRLRALLEIGLGYISLSRSVGSLSGGEAQRIKIAKYINSALSDLVYVLDEPSVGLHPKDIDLLRQSILRLNKQGNTILIVEHHPEIIKMADYVVDMGPSSGADGGEIIFSGSYAELLKQKDNQTAQLLQENTPLKKTFRKPHGFLPIENATLHNLKGVCVQVPLGVLTIIAGVAGSGKSSLMDFLQSHTKEEIIFIHQKDLGTSHRSTPATYLGMAEEIRSLFAKENKVSASLFSFNGKGACPACKGKGVIVSDMAFMDDIETPCEACGGKRFGNHVLAYLYRGKNIAQVNDMSVGEAASFFDDATIKEKLSALVRVGLSYLHLNQSLSTLSGGELQRLKLATKLFEKEKIFILDEPTDGLHLADVKRLSRLFHQLVSEGNTLILIAHSLSLMKEADFIIEMGEKAGDEGGHIIFQGTPKQMLESPHSVTGPYLRKSICEKA